MNYYHHGVQQNKSKSLRFQTLRPRKLKYSQKQILKLKLSSKPKKKWFRNITTYNSFVLTNFRTPTALMPKHECGKLNKKGAWKQLIQACAMEEFEHL